MQQLAQALVSVNSLAVTTKLSYLSNTVTGLQLSGKIYDRGPIYAIYIYTYILSANCNIVLKKLQTGDQVWSVGVEGKAKTKLPEHSKLIL